MVVILLGGFIIRYPLVDYNLPLAANVDERTSLSVLFNLERERLNPQFFHYPTFYYYMNFFLLRPLGDVEAVLRTGRILNLLVGLGLSSTVFILARHTFRSRLVALAAATLVTFSPIVSLNGSYIITDMLLATLIVLAMIFLGKFFATYDHKHWLAGVLFSGLALSTKYNAILIVVCYVILEFLWAPRLKHGIRPSNRWSRLLSQQIPRRILALLAFVIALLLLAIRFLLPESLLVDILQAGANINSVIDASDLAFLQAMRQRAMLLGLATAATGGLFLIFPSFAERFATLRPFAALILMMVVFLAGTPYALITSKSFLYDLGYELKTNEWAGNNSFWVQYFIWYRQRESLVVLTLAIVGVGIAFRERVRPAFVLALYLLLAYVAIGGATRGYPRYLTPLLPVLFTFAAFGMYAMARLLNRNAGRQYAGIVFVLLIVGGIALEMRPKVAAYLKHSRSVDEMHQAYDLIAHELQPAQVFFSGFAPHVELKESGIHVKEVTHQQLEDTHLAANLAAGELILVDLESNAFLSEASLNELELVWSTQQGFHQYIYRPRP